MLDGKSFNLATTSISAFGHNSDQFNHGSYIPWCKDRLTPGEGYTELLYLGLASRLETPPFSFSGRQNLGAQEDSVASTLLEVCWSLAWHSGALNTVTRMQQPPRDHLSNIHWERIKVHGGLESSLLRIKDWRHPVYPCNIELATVCTSTFQPA